tara:strand:+ start:4469 stop:4855 length:387 start_codon:yes stop_codon:yes gene_type:complete
MTDRDLIAEHFALKKPCSNCPFLKENGIELRRGRLESIIEGLVGDDSMSFICHKTLAEVDDKDYEENREPARRSIHEKEKACAGAAAYLVKAKRSSIGMRFATISGSISHDHWDEALPLVIDPKNQTK